MRSASAASAMYAADELRRRDHRAALVVGAVGHSSASSLPRARRGVALDPRGSDAALDLSPSVAELRFEERLAEALADDHVGVRLPRHRTNLTPWVPRGYHPSPWVPLWVPNEPDSAPQSRFSDAQNRPKLGASGCRCALPWRRSRVRIPSSASSESPGLPGFCRLSDGGIAGLGGSWVAGGASKRAGCLGSEAVMPWWSAWA